MQSNEFETEDSWFDVGQNTHEGQFTKVSKSYNYQAKSKNEALLYQSTIYMSEEGMKYKRIVYNLWDAFSDIGGIFQFVFVILGFLILPISEHNFILNAASHIFFARTKDSNIFMNVKDYTGGKICLEKYLDR